MSEPAPVRTPWLRLVVVLGLLTFSGVTLASNVIPKRDDLRATRRLLQEQRDENEAMRLRTQELREDARSLGENAWTVDRALREDLNRAHPREIIVR